MTDRLNAEHWLRLAGGVVALIQVENMAAHLG
jgi:hypothetical protein